MGTVMYWYNTGRVTTYCARSNRWRTVSGRTLEQVMRMVYRLQRRMVLGGIIDWRTSESGAGWVVTV
jgi:hypothetical protein